MSRIPCPGTRRCARQVAPLGARRQPGDCGAVNIEGLGDRAAALAVLEALNRLLPLVVVELWGCGGAWYLMAAARPSLARFMMR
jgi:hypothetical protein